MKDKLLISFSGGRTSAYMTKWLLDNKSNEYDFLVVFANTGKERQETLDFIRDCDKYFGFNTIWIEAVTNPTYGIGTRAKVVIYETASRNGEPFEAMIKKEGIPCQPTPICSERLKARPIKSYAKSVGWKDYYLAIGIRADEIDRMNPNYKKLRIIYPLVEAYITKKNINDWWQKQSFQLNLKPHEGNCDFCWKKSIKNHIAIINEHPEITKWWDEMEEKYSFFLPMLRKESKNAGKPHYFFRGNRSTKDLIKLANEFNKQGVMFEAEVPNGCSESCEPF